MRQEDRNISQIVRAMQAVPSGHPQRLMYAQALTAMDPDAPGPTPLQMEQHHAQQYQRQFNPNSPQTLAAQAQRAGMQTPMAAFGAPAGAPAGMPQAQDAAALQRVAAMGTNGDTMLAHINPAEADLLRRSGGSGTINPRTGLHQFGGGGGTINGAGGSGNVGGGGRGNAYGGGRGNNSGRSVDRVNDRPGVQHASWGNRAETSYGAPVHTNKLGVSVAQSPQKWAATVDQSNTYNKAANEWNAGAGRSFGNFVNALEPMGFSMQAPQLNRPATYSGGSYHLGLNPGALGGSLLGLGTGMFGASTLGGIIGGKAYEAVGGKNLVLSGPDQPKSWGLTGIDRLGTPSATSSPAQNNMGAFKGDQSGTMQTAQAAPGGAPFGPQPTGGGIMPPAAQTSQPGFFTPKIPNHSLPRDYQSMFPGSLSADDWALLYSKALA